MIRTLALLFAFSIYGSANEALQIVRLNPSHLEIRRGKDGPILVTCLTTETHGRPYLHPLRSPDGKGVLTQFSPGHHKHQTGLYWGPTRINGRDYFHNYNKDFWANTKLTQVTVGNSQPVWMTTSDLLDGDGKPILREEQLWSFHDHQSWYALDLRWTGRAIAEITIGKYDYGGLFLRMPWKNGVKTECLNSEGDKNQAGEGKSAQWVDLAMEIEGMKEMAHIAIIDHPGNPGYPALWRIDGQFGVGPALARRGEIKIPKGDSLTYRYRLVVYEGAHQPKLIDGEAAKFGAQ